MARSRLSSNELSAIADLDRMVHSPARLMILAYLYAAGTADFIFLMNETGLTRGNLCSHMSTLEEAGYVRVKKQFANKRPLTLLSLTSKGRAAFKAYRRSMKQFLDDVPE